jgi:hypothetical protein
VSGRKRYSNAVKGSARETCANRAIVSANSYSVPSFQIPASLGLELGSTLREYYTACGCP